MPDALKVEVRAQRRWRLVGPDGKSVCEGFTSAAKAEQWAAEQGRGRQGEVISSREYDPIPLLIQRIRSMAKNYSLRVFLLADTSKIAISNVRGHYRRTADLNPKGG